MTPHTPPELVREYHFEDINDTLGHAADDAVLAAFGARLTAWASLAPPSAGLEAMSSPWSFGCPAAAARTAFRSWSACCTRRSSWTAAAPSTRRLGRHRDAVRDRLP
ncbi:hypothetical protein [Streptomyces sp. NPDC017958]|uniref:hypothetical protein n=2 Tax=unclassified Streptomyces TaxID=2593676 RepID=UPI0037A95DD2